MPLLRIFYFVLAIGLSSCAGPQPIDLREWAGGMDTQWIKVKEHQLLMLEKPGQNSEDAIHIYIEGDGTPWVKRFFVAKNPTPRYPLSLALMKQDPHLSFYLGRPCYYQPEEMYLSSRRSNDRQACNYHYWTDARYSDKVVELMKLAIEEKIKQLPVEKRSLPLVVIGHSGGGTLAMLLAQRLPAIKGVITIAANMDTLAWTKKQGFSPLKNSLNLADQAQFRRIPQVHFAGSADKVVPPEINLPLMQKMGQGYNLINDFDHDCCWSRDWSQLLHSAELQLQQQTPPK